MTAAARPLTIQDLQEQLRKLQGVVTLNLELHQQRYETDQKAIKTAFDANSLRLDAMNEFRGAMSDLSGQMIPRKEAEAALQNVVERAELARNGLENRILSTIAPLEATLRENGRTNWALLTSLASVAALVVTGLWLVIGLKIDTSEAPIALAVEQLKIENTGHQQQLALLAGQRDVQVADVNRRLNRLSEDERISQLTLGTLKVTDAGRGDRLDKLEADLTQGRAQRDTRQAVVQEKLVEVETQFKGLSIVINLMKDDNHQMLGVLWSKVFPGVRLPDKNFRPTLYDETGAR